MKRLLLLPVALLALTACDADGDGLSNARENQLGTDKDLADSDGDGLLDGEELDYDCDPLAWSTDGDPYGDGDELHAGTDPLDDTDVIYEGGWPYNADKDQMSDPGLEGRLIEGEPLGHFVTVDQYGQEVDIYDFAGQGKPVIFDLSAIWCGPCRQLSAWLEGEPMAGMQQFEPVRDAVDSGDILWVTVITEDNGGAYPGLGDLQWWAGRYPNERVPVLADTPDFNLVSYFNLRFYPSLYLLDEDLVLQVRPRQSWTPALAAALDEL